jgi:hypothetical protein
MSVEKVSVSFEVALLGEIRGVAAKEGVSLSSWLGEAARARARQLALQDALADMDARIGPMSAEEADEILRATRAKSIVVRPRRSRR